MSRYSTRTEPAFDPSRFPWPKFDAQRPWIVARLSPSRPRRWEFWSCHESYEQADREARSRGIKFIEIRPAVRWRVELHPEAVGREAAG